MFIQLLKATTLCLLASGMMVPSALATPEFVTHEPTGNVFGESAEVTMREPDAPREGEAIAIWARVGYSFFWDTAAIYYTTDGSEPQGAFGNATQGQSIAMTFVRNEPDTPNNIDWLRGQIPSQPFATTVKYRIGVWSSGGGIEVFANNTGCSDDVCDTNPQVAETFIYEVELPWPGKGYPHADHTIGFPAVHFWKEEGVVGNNYINAMIDRNGTTYDVYYPSAGCVQGISTKNEGYVDGDDTFPPGLPLGFRGQMHLNQAMAGLRVNGKTYWLSNEAGDAYIDHAQSYLPETNVIGSSSRLVKEGASILVEQYDFAPSGITYPTDQGNQPARGMAIKRYLLTNESASAITLDFYYVADFALNGGDGFDAMFADKPRGALVGYDRTQRQTSSSGEYNPTSFGDYTKDVSVYLAAALKQCDAVGSAGGTPASGSWRDSSPDDQAGWVGTRLTLAPGETRELDVAIVGGFDNFPGATGTYDFQIAPVLDWFHATSMADVQGDTEAYWQNWLAEGVTIDFPDDRFDETFRRGLLATALHVDGENGGVIAGMHNGAYPFVWPRDGLYAAVTLDRTGHTAEAAEVFRFLRDVAYRDNDTWGKGFWYQKYTTDGFIVWNAPQVDETSNVTWAGYYHYLTRGETAFLEDYYTMFFEAGRAMSEDSSISSNLRYEESVDLMYSNNVWEDAFDTFVYSNATVVRGLEDAARIADVMDQQVCPGGPGTCNYHNDAALFTQRADAIRGGLDARLVWDGENTDISQLGIVWPFETHAADDPLAVHVMDRINGVAADRFGNVQPLTNIGNEWEGLINRYWGDTYWNNTGSSPNPNGSPWFLTTMWYGQYYAKLQDSVPGKAHIDNHRDRIERTMDFLGPIGFGAEQMAPTSSLLYPGETDFTLQTAWPNAWESMSFFTDAIMLFLDHVPDAPNQRLVLRPKLPSSWQQMTYRNIKVGPVHVDVTVVETSAYAAHRLVNLTGGTLQYDTHVRIPGPAVPLHVLENGSPTTFAYNPANSSVSVTGSMLSGIGQETEIRVVTETVSSDFDQDGDVDEADVDHFIQCASGPAIPQLEPNCSDALLDGDSDVDHVDFAVLQRCLTGQDQPVDPTCEGE